MSLPVHQLRYPQMPPALVPGRIFGPAPRHLCPQPPLLLSLALIFPKQPQAWHGENEIQQGFHPAFLSTRRIASSWRMVSLNQHQRWAAAQSSSLPRVDVCCLGCSTSGCNHSSAAPKDDICSDEMQTLCKCATYMGP